MAEETEKASGVVLVRTGRFADGDMEPLIVFADSYLDDIDEKWSSQDGHATCFVDSTISVTRSAPPMPPLENVDLDLPDDSKTASVDLDTGEVATSSA